MKKLAFIVALMFALVALMGCEGSSDGLCAEPYCTNYALAGEDYCSEHRQGTIVETCRITGCNNVAVRGGYCGDHVCLQGDCTNARVGDFYCSQHGG
ncbi:MAG: hypothetical protein Q4C01_02225 [Clostridia bacterium]|nr:hypothetical protein [Clostridia bacterium]